jgi:hypothetical protein
MPDDPNQEEEASSDDSADSADCVEEADKESFPASDPPASWAGGGDGH